MISNEMLSRISDDAEKVKAMLRAMQKNNICLGNPREEVLRDLDLNTRYLDIALGCIQDLIRVVDGEI